MHARDLAQLALLGMAACAGTQTKVAQCQKTENTPPRHSAATRLPDDAGATVSEATEKETVGLRRRLAIWDPSERFVAAVERAGAFGGATQPQIPRLRVHSAGGKERVFEGRGEPIAMLGNKPVLLIEDGGLKTWDFIDDTYAPSPLASLVPQGGSICVSPTMRVVIATDASGAIRVTTPDGKEVEFLSGSVSEPVIACEFSRNGESVALASEEGVSVYSVAGEALTFQESFAMHDVRYIGFSIDGRYVTGTVHGTVAAALGGSDRFGFFVHDRRQHVTRTRWGFETSDLTSNNQIVARDLDGAWYRYALSGERISGHPTGTQGSYTHDVVVSPKGRYAASVSGNWGGSVLEIRTIKESEFAKAKTH